MRHDYAFSPTAEQVLRSKQAVLPARVRLRQVAGDELTHHVLFVCGKNRLRSPTAEQVFADWEGLETSSAGVNRDADCPVTPELLEWADTVLVMEASHRRKLTAQFGPSLRGKRVVCLNIPDNFEFMQPALVELLLAKVPGHLPPRG